MQTKRMEKKLDGNCPRMIQAILNKCWKQHATKRRLYGHLPTISKIIQIRQTRHAWHCWRSKNELISDVLLFTSSNGRTRRPARIYLQQLCRDTGCRLEVLPEAMYVRDRWRKRVREISASGTTWWSWYIYIYIYIYDLACYNLPGLICHQKQTKNKQHFLNL